VKIYIGDLEPAAFAEPDGRSVKGLEKRAVSLAESGGGRGRFEEPLDLPLSQHRPWKPPGLGKPNRGSRVTENDASFAQEGKEAAEPGKVGPLRPGRQESAAAILGVLQQPQERPQVSFRDCAQVLDTLFF
jgi:hypothetical protein